MSMRKTIMAAVVAVTAVFAATAETLPGVLAEYYSFGSTSLSEMPDLDLLAPDKVLAVDQIAYAATAEAWDGLDDAFRDNFAARFTASLEVPADGDYTFDLESDDGSILYLDGTPVIDHSSLHAMTHAKKVVRLSAGRHRLRVDYFEKTGQAGLRLSWTGPGVGGLIPSGAFVQDFSSGCDDDWFADIPVPAAAGASLGTTENPPVAAEDSASGVRTPPAGCAFGLNADFYRLPRHVESLAEFETARPATPEFSAVVSRIYYPKTSNDKAWEGFPEDLVDDFGAIFEGYLFVAKSGRYTLSLSSDDGSDLWLDGCRLIDNGDSRHFLPAVERTVDLSAGLHALRLRYYERDGASGLTLSWSSADFEMRPIGGDEFVHAVEPSPEDAAAKQGLNAVFYRLPSRVETMDALERLVATLTPAVTATVSEVNYPKTTGCWRGLPSDMADDFGAFFDGYLYVDSADRYTFRLSSDDGSELWLDGDKIIDHGLSRHFAQYLETTVDLEPGFHPLKIRYYERDGASGLVLAWASSAFAMRPIAGSELVRSVGTMDADGDGMPGFWETLNGFSDDDPSDAAQDADGDGLVNLDEYRAGTDPRKADTDDDGLPDRWETERGTVPFLDDAHEDPDGDGLVNLDEYRNGTDPFAADTDGDGCPDGEEVFNLRSDPTVADVAWNSPMTIGETFSAAKPASWTGTWNVDGETVYSSERAGSVAWRVTVPEGADAIAFTVTQHDRYSLTDTFDLTLEVDGAYVTRTFVRAAFGETAEAVFFIPETGAGEHEFRLVWNNWSINTSLGVVSFRFLAYAASDADWREHRGATTVRLTSSEVGSLVSPYCVEGVGMWSDSQSVNVSYANSNAVVSAVRTIGDGFYANVPLDPDGAVTMDVGAEALSVVWQALDVFDGAYEEEPLLIRSGDSLRLGGGVATFSVKRAVNGAWTTVTNWTASAALVYEFRTAGDYLVTAVAQDFLGTRHGYALVRVVASRFPNRRPAVPLGIGYEIKCANLAIDNVLEHDPGLDVQAAVANKGVTLAVTATEDREYGVVSRLYENGPICDAAQVTPVWFDNGNYYHVRQTFPDGSQLVEVSLLVGAIPDGFSVDVQIFVSGVTFEDGTRTKTLTAADFDANGLYTLRFVKSFGVTTSVCHRTYLRQNGNNVLNNQ